MEKAILTEGAERFNVKASELKLLGGFANNVFEWVGQGEPFIVKFCSSKDYNLKMLKTELDWTTYLSHSGINITAPLLSKQGNHIEVFPADHGGEWMVLAFEKAKGQLVDESDPNSWNEDLFYTWGKVMGRIHALSKTYKPINETITEQEWYQGKLFNQRFESISEVVLQKWNGYIRQLQQLPKGRNSYGIIHNDLHQQNFFVHQGELVLFDFGDCEYHWFAYDISISLYHALQRIPRSDTKKRSDFASRFIQSFMKGYSTENSLDPFWLSKIPFFLNYRQVFSYLYFCTFLSNEQKKNERIKKMLINMRDCIENEIPYIELNEKAYVVEY